MIGVGIPMPPQFVETINTERVYPKEPFRVNGIPIVSPDNLVSNGIVHTHYGLGAHMGSIIIQRVPNRPQLSILFEFSP
jgi:hypothetical protein